MPPKKTLGMSSGPGEDLVLRLSSIETAPGSGTISGAVLHGVQL